MPAPKMSLAYNDLQNCGRIDWSVLKVCIFQFYSDKRLTLPAVERAVHRVLRNDARGNSDGRMGWHAPRRRREYTQAEDAEVNGIIHRRNSHRQPTRLSIHLTKNKVTNLSQPLHDRLFPRDHLSREQRLQSKTPSTRP